MPNAPVIPPEALLKHAAFLEQLARGLVRDPGLRDDLVQDTWIAAIRSPPREGRVRGWLATVLRNAARKARRGESRRSKREEATARPEVVQATSDQVAREQVMRRVVAAVFALEPERREVILLRFYEDLPPRVIAERLQMPVNTVKSRLRRAIAALRKDLSRDGSDWRRGLLGLVGLPPALIPTMGVSVASTTAIGAAVMGTNLKIVVAVAAAGLLGYGAWHLVTDLEAPASDAPQHEGSLLESVGSGKASDGSAPARAAAPVPRLSAQGSPAVPRAVSDAERGPVVRPQPKVLKKEWGPSLEELRERGHLKTSEPGVLEGVLYKGREVFSDAEAVVWKPGAGGGSELIPAGQEPYRVAGIARDGTYRFGELEPGSYYLGVRVGRQSRLVLRALEVGPKGASRALTVLGRASLSGRVYDESGRTVGDVSVRIAISSTGVTRGWDTMMQTRTDRGGGYRFEQLPPGGGWLSLSLSNDFDDLAKCRSRKVALQEGEAGRANFGSPDGTPIVSGVILTACGEPMRGPGRLIFNDAHSTQYVESAYDAEGKFSHRIPAGTHKLTVWFSDRNRHPSYAEPIELVVGERNGEYPITIKGARVRGRVQSLSGSAGIRARRVSWRGVKPPTRWMSTPIGADGTYALDGLTPGKYDLLAAPQENEQGIEPVSIVVRKGATLIDQDLVALPVE